MRHKVGELVINKMLGLGKVLEVRGDNVTVFFKDQAENPRIINVRIVPMALAEDQADPTFDDAMTRRKRSRKPATKTAAITAPKSAVKAPAKAVKAKR